jgi:sec-independent protein translocase protein TatA
MFGNFGTGELILVFLVILILFGAKKIPDLAQGLGKGLKLFKNAVKDVEDEVKDSTDDKKTDDKGTDEKQKK